MTKWVNTGQTALRVFLICVNTICNFKHIFQTLSCLSEKSKARSDLFLRNILIFFYSRNIWCANGNFEAAKSVNTDQTALTASLICDNIFLSFLHYSLDTLSCLSK